MATLNDSKFPFIKLRKLITSQVENIYVKKNINCLPYLRNVSALKTRDNNDINTNDNCTPSEGRNDNSNPTTKENAIKLERRIVLKSKLVKRLIISYANLRLSLKFFP